MLRISALNDSSSSDDGSQKIEITKTKEAKEAEAFAAYNKALSHQQKGNTIHAEKLLRNLLDHQLLTEASKLVEEENQIHIQNHPGVQLLYSIHKNLALILLQRGHPQEAMAAYIEAVRVDSSDVSVWFKMGQLARDLHNYPLAKICFQQALQCNPNHWPSLDNAITVTYALGDYLMCLENISTALQKDHSYPKGLALLKQILVEQPSLEPVTKELFVYCDPRIYSVRLSPEEKKEFINEALKIRAKRHQLYLEHQEQEIKSETVTVLNPLTPFTWRNVGQQLMDLYDFAVTSNPPKSLALEVDLRDYFFLDQVAFLGGDVRQDTQASSPCKQSHSDLQTSLLGRQSEPLQTSSSSLGRQPEPLQTSSSSLGRQSEPLQMSSSLLGRQPEPLQTSSSLVTKVTVDLTDDGVNTNFHRSLEQNGNAPAVSTSLTLTDSSKESALMRRIQGDVALSYLSLCELPDVMNTARASESQSNLTDQVKDNICSEADLDAVDMNDVPLLQQEDIDLAVLSLKDMRKADFRPDYLLKAGDEDLRDLSDVRSLESVLSTVIDMEMRELCPSVFPKDPGLCDSNKSVLTLSPQNEEFLQSDLCEKNQLAAQIQSTVVNLFTDQHEPMDTRTSQITETNMQTEINVGEESTFLATDMQAPSLESPQTVTESSKTSTINSLDLPSLISLKQPTSTLPPPAHSLKLQSSSQLKLPPASSETPSPAHTATPQSSLHVHLSQLEELSPHQHLTIHAQNRRILPTPISSSLNPLLSSSDPILPPPAHCGQSEVIMPPPSVSNTSPPPAHSSRHVTKPPVSHSLVPSSQAMDWSVSSAELSNIYSLGHLPPIPSSKMPGAPKSQSMATSLPSPTVHTKAQVPVQTSSTIPASPPGFIEQTLKYSKLSLLPADTHSPITTSLLSPSSSGSCPKSATLYHSVLSTLEQMDTDATVYKTPYSRPPSSKSYSTLLKTTAESARLEGGLTIVRSRADQKYLNIFEKLNMDDLLAVSLPQSAAETTTHALMSTQPSQTSPLNIASRLSPGQPQQTQPLKSPPGGREPVVPSRQVLTSTYQLPYSRQSLQHGFPDILTTRSSVASTQPEPESLLNKRNTNKSSPQSQGKLSRPPTLSRSSSVPGYCTHSRENILSFLPSSPQTSSSRSPFKAARKHSPDRLTQQALSLLPPMYPSPGLPSCSLPSSDSSLSHGHHYQTLYSGHSLSSQQFSPSRTLPSYLTPPRLPKYMATYLHPRDDTKMTSGPRAKKTLLESGNSKSRSQSDKIAQHFHLSLSPQASQQEVAIHQPKQNESAAQFPNANKSPSSLSMRDAFTVVRDHSYHQKHDEFKTMVEWMLLANSTSSAPSSGLPLSLPSADLASDMVSQVTEARKRQLGSKSQGTGVKRGSKRKMDESLSIDDWASDYKRRSTRSRNARSKKDDKSINFQHLMKKYFPPSLLPGGNEGETRRDGEIEMEVEKSEGGDDVNQIAAEMAALKQIVADEVEDVKAFIRKCLKGHGILDLIYKFLIHLAQRFDSVWYEGLVDVYLNLYKRLRKHLTVPNLFYGDDDSFTSASLLEYARIILACAELSLSQAAAEHETKSCLTPLKNGQPSTTSPASSQLLGDHHNEDTQFLMALTARDDILGSYFQDFCVRFYWLKAKQHQLLSETFDAVDNFEAVVELLENSVRDNCGTQSGVRILLPNVSQDRVISLSEANRQLECLQRCQSLEETQRLYDQQGFQKVVDTLIATFNTKTFSTKSLAQRERPTQLLLLVNSLYNLGQKSQCLHWAEASLHEAILHYKRVPTLQLRQDWATTLVSLLTSINNLMDEDHNILLEATRRILVRLARSLVSIIEICLDVGETVTDMPIGSLLPWKILYRILRFQESIKDSNKEKSIESNDRIDDRQEGKEGIESSLIMLRDAHEYLGRHSWCTKDEGSLLQFIMQTVEHEMTRKSEEDSEELAPLFEQCVYCLYGHPNKRGRARHLTDHNSTTITLTWERAGPVFHYLANQSIPEFDSYRTSTVTADVENLLRRIVALVPDSLNPGPKVSLIADYIDGFSSSPPTSPLVVTDPALDPYKITGLLFYLLADFYFKNKEPSKAVKFYQQDLVLNCNRLDAWAGLALAKMSQIEQKMNSNELKIEKPMNKNTEGAVRCFRRAVELEARNSKLWLEFGSLAYQLHSHASRQIKYKNLLSISEEILQLAVSRSSEMLSLAKNCYQQASECEGDEEGWLTYYMLGKVAEKQSADPVVYLENYKQAARYLHKEKAVYPKRIQFTNPRPHLALEALEVFYRIQVCVLKLALSSGKEDILSVLDEHISEAFQGHFARGEEKQQKSAEENRDEPFVIPKPSPALVPVKSQKVYHKNPTDHEYSRYKSTSDSQSDGDESRCNSQSNICVFSSESHELCNAKLSDESRAECSPLDQPKSSDKAVMSPAKIIQADSICKEMSVSTNEEVPQEEAMDLSEVKNETMEVSSEVTGAMETSDVKMEDKETNINMIKVTGSSKVNNEAENNPDVSICVLSPINKHMDDTESKCLDMSMNSQNIKSLKLATESETTKDTEQVTDVMETSDSRIATSSCQSYYHKGTESYVESAEVSNQDKKGTCSPADLKPTQLQPDKKQSSTEQSSTSETVSDIKDRLDPCPAMDPDGKVSTKNVIENLDNVNQSMESSDVGAKVTSCHGLPQLVRHESGGFVPMEENLDSTAHDGVAPIDAVEDKVHRKTVTDQLEITAEKQNEIDSEMKSVNTEKIDLKLPVRNSDTELVQFNSLKSNPSLGFGQTCQNDSSNLRKSSLILSGPDSNVSSGKNICQVETLRFAMDCSGDFKEVERNAQETVLKVADIEMRDGEKWEAETQEKSHNLDGQLSDPTTTSVMDQAGGVTESGRGLVAATGGDMVSVVRDSPLFKQPNAPPLRSEKQDGGESGAGKSYQDGSHRAGIRDLVVLKADLLDKCRKGLELCATRFPSHYKALYRLAYLYYNTKELDKARDLLLGRPDWQEQPHMPAPGLFSDRRQNNFFQGLWKIPVEDIDRSGCFASHVHRSVGLLLDVLCDLGDLDMLKNVHNQLRRTPDPGKKYLRDAERLVLAEEAFLKCVLVVQQDMEASEGWTEEQREENLLRVYQIWLSGKNCQYLDKVTDCLLRAFKIMMKGRTDINRLTAVQAVSFCQQNLSKALSASISTATVLTSTPLTPTMINTKTSTSTPLTSTIMSSKVSTSTALTPTGTLGRGKLHSQISVDRVGEGHTLEDVNTSRHIQPGVDSSRDIQPDADSSRGIQSDAEGSRYIQPAAEGSRDIQSGMDSSRDIQPSVDSSREIRLGADSSRNIQSGADSSRDIQLGTDSSRDIQPGVDSSRDVQPGVEPSRDVQPHVVKVGPATPLSVETARKRLEEPDVVESIPPSGQEPDLEMTETKAEHKVVSGVDQDKRSEPPCRSDQVKSGPETSMSAGDEPRPQTAERTGQTDVSAATTELEKDKSSAEDITTAKKCLLQKEQTSIEETLVSETESTASCVNPHTTLTLVAVSRKDLATSCPIPGQTNSKEDMSNLDPPSQVVEISPTNNRPLPSVPTRNNDLDSDNDDVIVLSD